MTDEEAVQLERDLAVLIDEEYLHSQLLELQEQQDNSESSEAGADLQQIGKRPASVSLPQGRQFRRFGHIEDHWGGSGALEEGDP